MMINDDQIDKPRCIEQSGETRRRMWEQKLQQAAEQQHLDSDGGKKQIVIKKMQKKQDLSVLLPSSLSASTRNFLAQMLLYLPY